MSFVSHQELLAVSGAITYYIAFTSYRTKYTSLYIIVNLFQVHIDLLSLHKIYVLYTYILTTHRYFYILTYVHIHICVFNSNANTNK